MRDGMKRKVLITGGAGFIGSNLAQRLLAQPDAQLRILDNFSRRGVEHNIQWLQSLPGAERLEIIRGDVREPRIVRQAVQGVTEIFHFAAQVAVTTSVEDPVTDFDINAQGTLNVLEAARQSANRPFLLFTSTNKVYGSLERVPVDVCGSHYCARQPAYRGVTEQEMLDFHSPYGCSKGTADQYVRDYARIYGLPTVVFRMSCIAGPRQFGNEDQGWVAHFLYSVLANRPIVIYGNGFQVRDVLHVHDLIDAMMMVRKEAARTQGEVYNLGGGMQRAVSVIEMLQQIRQKTGKQLKLEYRESRPGDQPWYVADTSKLKLHTGWVPKRSVEEILDAIHAFWKEKGARFVIQTGRVLEEEEVA